MSDKNVSHNGCTHLTTNPKLYGIEIGENIAYWEWQMAQSRIFDEIFDVIYIYDK